MSYYSAFESILSKNTELLINYSHTSRFTKVSIIYNTLKQITLLVLAGTSCKKMLVLFQNVQFERQFSSVIYQKEKIMKPAGNTELEIRAKYPAVKLNCFL